MFLLPSFLNQLFCKITVLSKILACFLISTLGALALNVPSSVPMNLPVVVVTIKPIYGLVATLMQGISTPTLLCEGRGSTHTLSLAPSDIKILSAADLVVWVGESYEMVMAKPLIKAIRDDQLLTLDTIKGLTLYSQRTGGLFPGQGCQHCCGEHDDHDHYHEAHDDEPVDAHEHSSVDGHFWLDIDNAKLCARTIATKFIQKWPMYKERVEQNLIKLEADLDALKVEIKTELSTVHGSIALIDHDSLQYVEKQFGFIIKGVLSEEHGMPPSIKHVEKLKDELNANLEEGLIKVFFYEGTASGAAPSLLKNLADAYSVRLAPMDYVGDQLPRSVDAYQACLRAIAMQVKSGLGQ